MENLDTPELEAIPAGLRTAPTGGQAHHVDLNGEYIHGMVKENTAWDIYNNEARKVDNELVKDWTASLNFLLVFVSRHRSFFSYL
jgi:hypothetical protein